ncbi:hypothetical protein AYO45_01095 [Gammaproteobacteria bacterium SCGC AG-212-F23]|nr:hypothetical protein AYO45_01095 [Gammaproteobacteria bacterium SCGC AG-212-F23]
MNCLTRIGLIGCGHWGRYILRDLKSLGCHVTVVSRSEKTRAHAREYHADKIVQQIDELNHIDGIVIATPTATHFSVIQKAAALSVPIFVEKPMTANLQDAEWLVENLRDRLFVMHKWRYHKGVQLLADIAKTQELGQVLGLHTHRMNWGSRYADVDMIWICLPHDLSISLEILGYIPTPRSAVAIEWGHETVELISVSGENPWNVVEISSVRPTLNREIRLECEYGVAVLKDGYDDYISIYHKKYWNHDLKKHTEIRPFTNEMPLLCELREFVDYLHGGALPKSDAKEGLAVVRAITEIRRLAGIKHSGILPMSHMEISQ